ncbi:uncharacterized protein LOC107421439 [Ziziphus jujuba]|uniref:Uncharacterized protein LOC107421439 n=3 Tax=Ziziphus jujuba TaxID=326968 RepID=A0A6P6G9D8_ZIZJJ|nr:uncharacterized protein LOC107421439 [Ziziphus jujuba]XP_015886183.3 uncharacterized protein LOC107421439 [Ziziphus jujuba]
MVVFLKLGNFFFTIQSRRLEKLSPFSVLNRFCHFAPKPQENVAIFWDLDNKPPDPFPPYAAAIKLKATASSFGFVQHMIAYANRHSFSYVPPVVRERRKERKLLNQLENKGVIKPVEPYLCRVCGRKFYNNEKLVNHFKQLHEREHMKRLNQIESARGSRRVKLVGKYSMKMEKYKNAARDVLTPKVGYGLADELKRAGFWVQTVSDKPQAADVALKKHMVDMMDQRGAQCFVLVSDDSDFVDVLNEAKLRCLKTVVVGNVNDGTLKRIADAGFSWKEIMMKKAKKEAVSVVGKWKDRDVLKRLEWTYDPQIERNVYRSDDEDEDLLTEGSVEGVHDGCMQEDNSSSWWEIDSDSDIIMSQRCK